MTLYRCTICNTFEYDDSRGSSTTNIKPGILPKDFPDDWQCPICGASKDQIKKVNEQKKVEEEGQIVCPKCGDVGSITITRTIGTYLKGYLGEWKRDYDSLETHMANIHEISITGESILEPMRTTKDVISWDNILIKGAQLAQIPYNPDIPVNTKTIIGPKADQPLTLNTPIYITHMSFGALSREIKVALAKGSAAAQTAMCSGEGGILKESMEASHKYIFEYVPNLYSVSEDNLRRVDAIEIKIGQSVKPGMGGHLPAEKVTKEIAALRGFPEKVDIISPSHFDDITDKINLKNKVDWLRETSRGKPIGIKFAAGDIEADLEVATSAGPDFITLDTRPGSTAAAPKFVKDATSISTIFALYRARKYFDDNEIKGVSLIITGGLRVSSDFAKALALGADAVAIGTTALMACACQQYRQCNTGKCPVGITTHDPNLRSRLNIDISAKKLENFLKVSTDELKDFARLTGNNDVHMLSPRNLVTTNSEISNYTSIQHV